ncbi:hypothetical protein AB0C84_40105 [Actinomadura sp. NPDC048955]|uniref:hypothetical protein n=1 Tax=Actinomadura sp. NPDC048955 TaxID=3158228 RepID=UPI0033FCE2CC
MTPAAGSSAAHAHTLLDQSMRRWVGKPSVAFTLPAFIAAAVGNGLRSAGALPDTTSVMRTLLETEGTRLARMFGRGHTPDDQVTITTPRLAAVAIVGLLQAYSRHPGAPDGISDQLRHHGRQVQDLVCDGAELYALLEAGWTTPIPAATGTHRQGGAASGARGGVNPQRRAGQPRVRPRHRDNPP